MSPLFLADRGLFTLKHSIFKWSMANYANDLFSISPHLMLVWSMWFYCSSQIHIKLVWISDLLWFLCHKQKFNPHLNLLTNILTKCILILRQLDLYNLKMILFVLRWHIISVMFSGNDLSHCIFNEPEWLALYTTWNDITSTLWRWQ